MLNNPHKLFKWLIFIVAIAMLFATYSCDCQWHLKQIKKKCNNTFQSDTIRSHDTIYIKESRVDTLFKKSTDTVRINNDRLHIKYFYNSHDSTVYIQGKCDQDTIVVEKQTIINSNEFKADIFSEYKWWIIGLILALLLIAILRK
jgi:hypothetical protein